jgi:hypothetical protein
MTGVDGNPFCLLTVNGAFNAQTWKALQWKLNARGRSPALVVDGQFGNLTSEALEWYLGTTQNHTLFPGNGSFNGQVVDLQSLCAGCGFPVTEDGKWGSKTQEAVQLSLNSTRF